MEFLWVRWFRRDTGYRCIPDMARLPRMEFMDHADDEAFGFLDPDHVIRGAHLIPAFHYGRTQELLPKSIARQESEEDQDWTFYYANGKSKYPKSTPLINTKSDVCVRVQVRGDSTQETLGVVLSPTRVSWMNDNKRFVGFSLQRNFRRSNMAQLQPNTNPKRSFTK
ncbi:hypothetical protein C8F01DRAFT_1183929, partial [Mycena amicta]